VILISFDVTVYVGSCGTIGAETFVAGIESNVRAIQERLEDIESSVCGPIESRLSQVTMFEILQKCKAVHQANDSMIMILEKKLSSQGKKVVLESTTKASMRRVAGNCGEKYSITK
jgi:predicted kinase